MKVLKNFSQSVLLLSTLCACAQAPTVSYKIVDTDQVKCFDNSDEIAAPKVGEAFYGQDAQYIGNTPSYVDNGDGTVTDLVTGLVWQKGYSVMSYAEAIKAAESFELAGFSDWRVPTIKEGYSLIIFSGSDVSPGQSPSGGINGVPFINTTYFEFEYGANGARAIDSQMLSSTLYVGSTETENLVFGVNFADGRIKGYGLGLGGGDKQFLVRFVRGAEYGVNDFADNGDGTISDNATGLMWGKADSGEAMNWGEALAYAQKMNEEKYLGHSDWRVPNAKELQSIVDYSRSPLTTSSAAIDPLFESSVIVDEAGEKDYPFYWTSTTHENSASANAGSAGVYVAFGRSLGNMSNSQGMGMGMMPPPQGGQGGMQQRPPRGGQQAAGQRPERGERREGGQRPQHGEGMQRPEGGGSSTPNWVDIHGAGSQRSDPKTGDAAEFANGNGPQGDAIRINNYVRLVRDL